MSGTGLDIPEHAAKRRATRSKGCIALFDRKHCLAGDSTSPRVVCVMASGAMRRTVLRIRAAPSFKKSTVNVLKKINLTQHCRSARRQLVVSKAGRALINGAFEGWYERRRKTLATPALAKEKSAYDSIGSKGLLRTRTDPRRLSPRRRATSAKGDSWESVRFVPILPKTGHAFPGNAW